MKIGLLSVLLSGLSMAAQACSPAGNEPEKTEEPTPVPDPQPTGSRALVCDTYL